MTIRILLADDHPVVLAGLSALLRHEAQFELVGEACCGAEALALMCRLRPDVAVIDLSMPEPGGLELAGLASRQCPEVRLVALTVHEDRAYVQRLLGAGGRGYILKRSAAEDLPRAIRAVAEGGLYLDPAIAGKAVSDPSGGGDEHELSPREQAVLELTALGFGNKEIAGRLELSTKTVETYKARGLDKLGLRSRADIVRHAAASGWLDKITSA